LWFSLGARQLKAIGGVKRHRMKIAGWKKGSKLNITGNWTWKSIDHLACCFARKNIEISHSNLLLPSFWCSSLPQILILLDWSRKFGKGRGVMVIQDRPGKEWGMKLI
jgi:hypothetical protein